LLSGIPVASIVWKPLVAATCMATYLAVSTSRRDILTCVSAMLIYVTALVALAIWASGGPRQFKDKFLPLLSQ